MYFRWRRVVLKILMTENSWFYSSFKMNKLQNFLRIKPASGDLMITRQALLEPTNRIIIKRIYNQWCLENLLTVVGYNQNRSEICEWISAETSNTGKGRQLANVGTFRAWERGNCWLWPAHTIHGTRYTPRYTCDTYTGLVYGRKTKPYYNKVKTYIYILT